MNINPVFLADKAVDYSEKMDMADAVSFGIETVLLGMGVVFSVLIILWAVLSVFKLIFYKPAASESKPSANEKKQKPAEEAAPELVPELVPAVPETDNAELVAVITAAIASMLDAPQTSFRVVSFRRTAKK